LPMKILKKELDKLVWLGSTICENPILLINLLGTNTQFSIQDNGKGLSVDFAIDERSSLGVKLVSSLIAQLGAELKVKWRRHNLRLHISTGSCSRFGKYFRVCIREGEPEMLNAFLL